MPTKKNRPTDAIALLKQDHKEVRGLLSQLDKTTARSETRRTELLEKIARAVRVHSKIEEEIFYPAFHAAAQSKEDEKMFFEAAEEHGLVDVVLPALEDADPSSDVFAAKAKVLKDLIEHHAEEEETEMFPRARKLLGAERLEQLGERLASRSRELLERTGSPKRRTVRSA
jgi:hemerythrin-like domain-containing protein